MLTCYRDQSINSFVREILEGCREGKPQTFSNRMSGCGMFRRGYRVVSYSVLAPLIALADDEVLDQAFQSRIVVSQPGIGDLECVTYDLATRGCGIPGNDVSKISSGLQDYYDLTSIQMLRYDLRDLIPDGSATVGQALDVLTRMVSRRAVSGAYADNFSIAARVLFPA